MKRLWETLSEIIVRLLLFLTVATLFSLVWSAKSHNFYRDWEFTYYLEQFGLLKYAGGNDVIEKLGQPRDIGSDTEKADKAYKSERSMVDHYGFILGKKHEISDGI